MQSVGASMTVASRARPFLKWAGGKTQLLDQIAERFPAVLKHGQIDRYVEPFIGGGAVFLYVAQRYPVEQFVLFDINRELILAYRTLQRAADDLIEKLEALGLHYHALDGDERRMFFYRVRERFNAAGGDIDYRHFDGRWVERTAQIIFLNRTCYNGLFRMNTKAQFNVPFGRYRNPSICMPENLKAVASLLARARIELGDFSDCAALGGPGTFMYFDPPYRPLSKTARFTAYSAFGFDDAEQLRLAQLYRTLDAAGAKLMLSNSDPLNTDPADDFLERAYAGFEIRRVHASRLVNCRAARRGAITELLITNYPQTAGG